MLRQVVFHKLLFLALLAANFSCQHTDRRFALIEPEESGLDFVNRLEEKPEMNVFNYLYFYNGGGVAAGDLNNDGLPDLYFTSNLHENRLYLNKGGLKFEDITEAAGVAGQKGWTTGVTMADVNADGLLDIYVSQVGDFQNIRGRNQLYINQGADEKGNPRFKDEARAYGLDLKGFGTQAAFFDYDLDGDLDMYMLNHSVHANGTYGKATLRQQTHKLAGDRLMRNDGGKFIDVTAESGIFSSALGYGLGISIADVNWDGYPDIYVGNDFHENDYLYINQGNGTFIESLQQQIQHTSRYSMGNDIADFNNDGLPDILSLDMLPADPEKLKASAAEDPYEVYNFKLKYGYGHQFARNTLQLNQGNWHFSEVGLLSGVAATDWSWSGLFADLDLDGYKDIFVANGIKRRSNDLDYINYVSNEAVQSQLAGDISQEDLLLTEKMPVVKIPNYAFRNTGSLQFEDVSQSWGLKHESFSNGAAYADLDGDGDLDLVTNNVDQPAFLYENLTIKGDEQQANFLKLELVGAGGNTQGLGAKVIIPFGKEMRVYEHYNTRGFQSAVSDDLILGLGDVSLVDSLLIIWPDRRFQWLTNIPAKQSLRLRQQDATGQFNFQKQKQAALFEDLSDTLRPDYVHQENSYIEFNREALLPHMNSTEGPRLAVADLNGDGRDDFFVGGAKHQPGQLFMQTASGFVRSPQPAISADSLAEDVGLAFTDYNGDGHLDLLVASGGNEFQGQAEPLALRFYRNDGQGNFLRDRAGKPEVYANASVVRPFDYDGDGDEDIFVGGRVLPWNYGLPPESFLLRNEGGGNFTDVTDETEGLRKAGMVKDARWADLDGDGAAELILLGEWMPVYIFSYAEGKLQLTETLENSEGWWNSLQLYDVDEDGDLDLLAGNLGLNSKLRASPEEPLSMVVKDFDENGRPDQLLYHYLQGEKYLFATRDEMVDQLSVVKAQYGSYEAFAKAQQGELFSGQRQDALELQATELRSGLFLNEGKLQFRFMPFPEQAQISPIQAIAVQKQGDEILILTGGNFYEVNIQRGRYDADYGTLMAYTPEEGFRWIPNREAGLWLKGQVRDIAPIRIGDRHCLLLARNNDSLQIISQPKAFVLQ